MRRPGDQCRHGPRGRRSRRIRPHGPRRPRGVQPQPPVRVLHPCGARERSLAQGGDPRRLDQDEESRCARIGAYGALLEGYGGPPVGMRRPGGLPGLRRREDGSEQILGGEREAPRPRRHRRVRRRGGDMHPRRRTVPEVHDRRSSREERSPRFDRRRRIDGGIHGGRRGPEDRHRKACRTRDAAVHGPRDMEVQDVPLRKGSRMPRVLEETKNENEEPGP